MKWIELEKLLRNQNFVSEIIPIDRTLIEQKKCSKKHSLAYFGKNNGVTSLGVGVCYQCGTAEIFPEHSTNAESFMRLLGLGGKAKKAA